MAMSKLLYHMYTLLIELLSFDPVISPPRHEPQEHRNISLEGHITPIFPQSWICNNQNLEMQIVSALNAVLQIREMYKD